MGWFTKKKERPDATDAAIRAIILRHLVSHTFLAIDALALYRNWGDDARKAQVLIDFSKNRHEHWSSLGSLRKHISPLEDKYVQSTLDAITETQSIGGSWRAEAMGTILWALGSVPKILPYDSQFLPEDCQDFLTVNAEKFIDQARFRPQEEIDRARDTAELWHWRSRTRQIIEEGQPFPTSPEMTAAGFTSYDDIVRTTAKHALADGIIVDSVDADFPAFGKAYRDLTAEEWSTTKSITMERHFALNWLCGYAPDHKWDDTPTDT